MDCKFKYFMFPNLRERNLIQTLTRSPKIIIFQFLEILKYLYFYKMLSFLFSFSFYNRLYQLI